MSVKKSGLLLLLYYLSLLFGELRLLSFKTLCLSLVHLRLMVFAFIRWNYFIIRSNYFLTKTSKQDIKHSSTAGIIVGFLICRLFIANIWLTLYNIFKSRFLNWAKHCYGPNLIIYLLKQKLPFSSYLVLL